MTDQTALNLARINEIEKGQAVAAVQQEYTVAALERIEKGLGDVGAVVSALKTEQDKNSGSSRVITSAVAAAMGGVVAFVVSFFRGA